MRPIAQLRLHLALRRDRSADDADMKACRVEALEALRLLDDRLRAQGPTGWVATSALPGIADVALYPYSRMAPLGGIDLEQFPAVTDWLARVEALPGYQALFPGQPELNLSTVER
jgi:glutathione S-transferase